MLQTWSVLLTITVLAAPLGATANGPPHSWSQRFGDSDAQEGWSVAFDGQGNVFFSGQFEGTVDLGGSTLTSAGGNDIFLAKFDASGNHLWSHCFGDTNNDNAPRVAVDALGNVVMTGYFSGTLDFGGGPLSTLDAYDTDVFLAKFDPFGDHLWSYSFGDWDAELTFTVALDASGNIVWTGHFSQTIDFGAGVHTSTSAYDMYLAKFDPDGNCVWSESYGNTGAELSTNVAVDAAGNVVVSGRFTGTVDFGGGVLATAGGDDVYLVKFGPDGVHHWSRRFGDENFQLVAGLAVDGSGNVAMTGSFLGGVDFGGGILTSAGSHDIYLAKYDPDGNHHWSSRFGDEVAQQTRCVTFDSGGNVLVTGYFGGTVDFGGDPLVANGSPFSDIFLAKFDPDGSHIWSARFGDADLDYAGTVALDLWDNIVITGRFRSTVDFGGGVLTSAGDDDAFLAKFRPTATGVPRVLGPELGVRAYPNPFNPTTTLSFNLPRAGFVRLQLFDVNGALLATLVNGSKPMGAHVAAWDGRDMNGSDAASGVYFARLAFEGSSCTQKVVLLK